MFGGSGTIKSPTPYIEFFLLSERFGWTPQEIMAQPPDIIEAYSTIMFIQAKEDNKRAKKEDGGGKETLRSKKYI